MTYPETLDYLFSRLPMFQRVGAAAYKADLTNTIALCKLLENPERKFKSIHIAGTNGKGSVSHMVASIMQEAGFKTGLYTSPHLKDFRERIRVNGEKISEQYVIDFVEKYKDALEAIQPSFFEYTFGMAISFFAEEKVDIAIMETGMGGRLDSTNVIHPEVSIITNIGFDHVQFLGDTLEKIAIEKAGIIKENTPVIIGETQLEIKHVFEGAVKRVHTKISFADKNYKIQDSAFSEGLMKLTIKKTGSDDIIKLSCPLSGNYQQKNVLTALAGIEKLKEQGWDVSRKNISHGFVNVVANTGIQGRWQVLKEKPLTICDTGHNVDGITYIVEQIQSLKFDKLHFVLGMVNDKNIDQVLSLLPENAQYYFCKANISRGLDVDELKRKAESLNLSGKPYKSVKKAFDKAKQNAAENDLVFVGGSTFIVAEVL
jgi:dihydrofolate synthase/folylpolyglutamate synthase